MDTLTMLGPAILAAIGALGLAAARRPGRKAARQPVPVRVEERERLRRRDRR